MNSSKTTSKYQFSANGPMLPPLYFEEQARTTSAAITTTTRKTIIHPAMIERMLPPEIVHQCIVGYCDWGDLARLASVQSSWKNIVSDAASYGGRESKWELAMAMMDGTHGMAKNAPLAVTYFEDLAGVSLDQIPENHLDGENDLPTTDNHTMQQQQQHHHQQQQQQQTEERDENKNDTNSLVSSRNAPFAPAMRKLASCYLTGNGVNQESTIGLRWLRAAHHCGADIDAAFSLAVLYEYGQCNVPIDVILAAHWFRRAAKSGHVEAMAEYALCCELGCGVEQDDASALEWYTKAAEAGHIGAKFSVGEAFEEARGVPQSDEEACLWYYKAAVDGDEDSKKALRRLRDIARIVVPGVGTVLDA